MSERLPTLTASEVIRFLESLGFQASRQKGSHRFFRHPDGRTATVPVHPGEDIGRGLLSKILRDAETGREALLEWLRSR